MVVTTRERAEPDRERPKRFRSALHVAVEIGPYHPLEALPSCGPACGL